MSYMGVVSSSQWVYDWLQIARTYSMLTSKSPLLQPIMSTNVVQTPPPHVYTFTPRDTACCPSSSKLSSCGWCHQCFLWSHLAVSAFMWKLLMDPQQIAIDIIFFSRRIPVCSNSRPLTTAIQCSFLNVIELVSKHRLHLSDHTVV